MRRTLRLLKDAHPINAVLENARILERLPHRTLGKRHTLLHMTMRERQTTRAQIVVPRPLQEFVNLVKDIPFVEDKIENDVIEAMKTQLSPEEIKEVEDAQYMRKVITQNEINHPKKVSRVPEPDKAAPPIDPDLHIKDLSNITVDQIGKYFKISKEEAIKYFTSGYFGNFFRDTFQRSNNLDIMMREETFNIIQLMKASQNVNPLKIFPQPQSYEGLNGLSHCEQYKWLMDNDLNTYLKIFRKIGFYLNEVLDETQNLKIRNAMKHSPEFFHQVNFLLMHELRNQDLHDVVFGSQQLSTENPFDSIDTSFTNSKIKGFLNGILEDVSKKITDEDSLRQLFFGDYYTHVSKTLDFELDGRQMSIKLDDYADTKKRPKMPKELLDVIIEPQRLSVGSLLTGMKGNGKSQVLAGAAYWAANDPNWVVVKVPRSDLTRNRTRIKWDASGLYLLPEVAYDYLLDIWNTNKDKLATMKIKKELYGKYNVAGLHDEYDANYKPTTPVHEFIRDLQCYTDDWKKEYTEEYLEDLMQGVREMRMEKRTTMIEYEINFYENRKFPDIWNQRWNNSETYYDNISLDTILPINCPKRKPKKRMLPKVVEDNNIFEYNPKPIYSQNLNIKEAQKKIDYNRIQSSDEEIEEIYIEELQPIATRIADKIPDPENVYQLVDYCMKNPIYCTNAVCEILEQLYHTDDFNVLVVVDSYNDFFRPSEFPSIKYVNYKKMKSCIPPCDISLARAFMRFDGHRIKNGIKVVGTTEFTRPRQKNICTAKVLNIDPSYEMRVDYLALNDFRKAVHHYRLTQWTFQHFDEGEIEDIYMMSQGNWLFAHNSLEFYNYQLY